MTMKKCSRCKETKPFTEYDTAKRSKDGFQNYCRSCCKAYQKKWRAENREHHRATQRARYAANPEKACEVQRRYRDKHRDRLSPMWRDRRRAVTLAQYGLTPASYEELLKSQDHACAICRSTDPRHWSGRFQIDHDHDTGKVRGLLCASCNGGLGLFRDDPKRLAVAITYLMGSPTEKTSTAEESFSAS